MADQDVGAGQPADEAIDMDALVAALSREALLRRRWGLTILVFYSAAFLGPLVPWLLRCAVSGNWTHPWPSWIGLLNFVTWGCAFLTSRLDRRSSASRLASCGDERAVGALAQVASPGRGMFEYQEHVRKQAAIALTRLLPKLRASDARLLTDPQRDALLRLLHGNDQILVAAILRSLEQIGDERFVAVVEELAEGKHSAETNHAVREAARTCLPTLRERVRQEHEAALLLRPASAPDGTLLRPASGAAPADEALLLRASESDEA